MKTARDLKDILYTIDHKSYPAYKSLKGDYAFKGYQLSVDRVQGDPFAGPSHIRIFVADEEGGFPGFCKKDELVRTALSDYLLRQFEHQIHQFTFRAKGSGKSGQILVTHCGQEVLKRSACEVNEKGITIRFFVGFPANGRTINARELEKIFFEYLPECVEKSLYYKSLSKKEVEKVVFLAEDQDFIRKWLKENHLLAFVADGAILPRESGVSQRPMKGALRFSSPDSMRMTVKLPHKGEITGMAIREGITLIVGGGYHGKSTLLSALELGVYNHIAGDGREYVIADESGLKLRSEDGRFIKDVDISMFINDLPNGKDTKNFFTEDASGSTSQAAGIVEGIEAGSRIFFLDEDTSATNFMVRDSFMQEVISPDKEPITPFLARARDLYEVMGISTVLVAGSSGAFFHIADCIIQMDGYQPVDITAKVKCLCEKYPLPEEKAREFKVPQMKRVMTKDLSGGIRRRDYRSGKFKDEQEVQKIKVLGKDGFLLGKQAVELRYMEQLVDSEQTAALAKMLKYAVEDCIDGKRTLSEIVNLIEDKIKKEGLYFFAERGHLPGGFALPRRQEIYGCFNRYRRG